METEERPVVLKLAISNPKSKSIVECMMLHFSTQQELVAMAVDEEEIKRSYFQGSNKYNINTL